MNRHHKDAPEGLRDYHDVPFPEGTQPATGDRGKDGIYNAANGILQSQPKPASGMETELPTEIRVKIDPSLLPKPAGEWTELLDEAAFRCSATTQDERKRVISELVNAALDDQKRDLWEKISLSRIEADNWKALYEKKLAALREVNALARGNMTGCGTCSHVIDATLKPLAKVK